MSRSSEAQAPPLFDFSRWKALPGMAAYYLIGSLIFPVAFVASQVGLEWRHPTSTRPAAPPAIQPNPVLPAAPALSPDDIHLLRAEIAKAVREAVKAENEPLKQQLASISAQLSLPDPSQSFYAALDSRVGKVPYKLDQFVMLDAGTKGDAKYDTPPYDQDGFWKSNTFASLMEKKIDTYFPPTPAVTVKLKDGKTVTILSSDPAVLKEVQEKLAGQ